jgi:hypothetical protein
MILQPGTYPPLGEEFSKASAPPLKSILLVGGVLEGGRLYREDVAKLRNAVMMARAQGATFSPETKVAIANLSRDSGGEDFLGGGMKADMILMCFLFNPPPRDEQDREGYYAVSPRHHEPGIWHDSVVKAGAKALWVVGGWSEINSDHFMPEKSPLRLIRDNHMISFFLRENYAKKLARAQKNAGSAPKP